MIATSHITTRIEPWIDSAIAKYSPGEEVLWEQTVMPFVDVPGQQPSPRVTIFFWFTAPVVGTVMNGSLQIHNPFQITEEEIHENISGMIEQMRVERSAQLQETMRESGIILNGLKG